MQLRYLSICVIWKQKPWERGLQKTASHLGPESAFLINCWKYCSLWAILEIFLRAAKHFPVTVCYLAAGFAAFTFLFSWWRRLRCIFRDILCSWESIDLWQKWADYPVIDNYPYICCLKWWDYVFSVKLWDGWFLRILFTFSFDFRVPVARLDFSINWSIRSRAVCLKVPVLLEPLSPDPAGCAVFLGDAQTRLQQRPCRCFFSLEQ